MKAGIEKIDRPCPLCKAKATRLIASGVDHEYSTTTSDRFNIVECQSCGTKYLNPRPADSELGVIYPPDYYSNWIGSEYEDAARRGAYMLKVRMWYYEKKYRKLAQLCQMIPETERTPFRVLDVGCGDGRLLTIVKELYEREFGGPCETFGVEYSEESVKRSRARGHQMFRGDICELEIPQRFHLIISNDVIEHVADPVSHGSRLADLLIPGGILQVQTPNIDAWDWELCKKHWGGYHLPRHWTFFTRKSLSTMLRGFGLDITEVEYFSSAVFWNWTFHAMLTEWKMPKLADRLFHPVRIYGNSFYVFLFLMTFSMVDEVIKKLSGRTSNMNIYARRPILS
jgi:SAM-dependent methyltransferase